MANADQLKALIKSHADGDDMRFYAIAIQMAAHAARTGHTKLAQDLRDLIDKAKATEGPKGMRTRPVALAQPRGELASLLLVSYPKQRLSDMALDSALHNRIKRVLLEQRQREKIREHGLAPLRKLLLVGAPGTGKTMTAAVLAAEASLPLLTIQLDALITKYMGETAAKLRMVFDAIEQTRGVYLFDEFDALGGRRGERNDVGEIRRVLNSFLQFLERDASDSLIIAATNHAELLDRALFRRFDSVLEYRLPTPELADRVIKSALAVLDTRDVDWKQVKDAAEGLSHADLTRACQFAAKEAILEGTTKVKTQTLTAALRERCATEKE